MKNSAPRRNAGPDKRNKKSALQPLGPRGYSIALIDLAGEKHRQVIVDKEGGRKFLALIAGTNHNSQHRRNRTLITILGD